MPALPPSGPTPASAHVRLAGGRYLGPGGWSVDVPALEADMTARVPGRPLDVWDPTAYRLHVVAGRVTATARQVTEMVADLAGPALEKTPVRELSVAFPGRDRVRVAGRFHKLGIDWPFGLDYDVRLVGPNRIALAPRHPWIAKAMFALGGIAPASLVPIDLGAAVHVGADGAIALDLAHVPDFDGRLAGLVVGHGRLEARFGDGDPAPIAAARRGGSAHWLEIAARGEVAIAPGILRDGTAVATDTRTPDTPLVLTDWQDEGLAHIESGEVILDAATLAHQLAATEPAYTATRVQLVGTDLQVEGRVEIPASLFGADDAQRGLAIPIGFTLRFGLTPDGRLTVTPGETSGLAAPGLVRTMLAKLPGARPWGRGITLDLAAFASVDAGKLAAIRTEPDRLVLVPAPRSQAGMADAR